MSHDLKTSQQKLKSFFFLEMTQKRKITIFLNFMQKTRQIDQKLGVVDTFQNNREYIRKTQKKVKKGQNRSQILSFFLKQKEIF